MDIDQQWVKENIDLIMKEFLKINPEFDEKTNSAMIANKLSRKPISWANLFGGPATGLLGLPRTGTIIFVAIKPMGLNVGPVKTRAVNP